MSNNTKPQIIASGIIFGLLCIAIICIIYFDRQTHQAESSRPSDKTPPQLAHDARKLKDELIDPEAVPPEMLIDEEFRPPGQIQQAIDSKNETLTPGRAKEALLEM